MPLYFVASCEEFVEDIDAKNQRDAAQRFVELKEWDLDPENNDATPIYVVAQNKVKEFTFRHDPSWVLL